MRVFASMVRIDEAERRVSHEEWVRRGLAIDRIAQDARTGVQLLHAGDATQHHSFQSQTGHDRPPTDSWIGQQGPARAAGLPLKGGFVARSTESTQFEVSVGLPHI